MSSVVPDTLRVGESPESESQATAGEEARAPDFIAATLAAHPGWEEWLDYNVLKGKRRDIPAFKAAVLRAWLDGDGTPKPGTHPPTVRIADDRLPGARPPLESKAPREPWLAHGFTAEEWLELRAWELTPAEFREAKAAGQSAADFHEAKRLRQRAERGLPPPRASGRPRLSRGEIADLLLHGKPPAGLPAPSWAEPEKQSFEDREARA